MAVSDVFTIPAPARFSIAGAFAMAVIFASLMHAPEALDRTGPLGLVAWDKWVHAVSFAAVAFLFAYAAVARSALSLLAIAVALTLLGIGVELIQSTIPWRTMERADVLANGSGIVFAISVWKTAWWLQPTATDSESTTDAATD